MSAALDDEADAFELRRMLDETAGNDELREEWHRLNLMRDIMREDVPFAVNIRVGEVRGPRIKRDVLSVQTISTQSRQR